MNDDSEQLKSSLRGRHAKLAAIYGPIPQIDADGFSHGFSDAEIHTLVSDAVETLSDFRITEWEELHEHRHEREEYALRGAWRAGYRYLHVFEREPATRPLGRDGFDRALTLPGREYVPSNTPDRPRPTGLRYQYSVDFETVPDDVIRDEIQQE